MDYQRFYGLVADLVNNGFVNRAELYENTPDLLVVRGEGTPYGADWRILLHMDTVGIYDAEECWELTYDNGNGVKIELNGCDWDNLLHHMDEVRRAAKLLEV